MELTSLPLPSPPCPAQLRPPVREAVHPGLHRSADVCWAANISARVSDRFFGVTHPRDSPVASLHLSGGWLFRLVELIRLYAGTWPMVSSSVAWGRQDPLHSAGSSPSTRSTSSTTWPTTFVRKFSYRQASTVDCRLRGDFQRQLPSRWHEGVPSDSISMLDLSDVGAACGAG